MDIEKLEEMITQIAKQCNVMPNMALAIAYVESGIDTTKVRYEAPWRYLVSPDKYAKNLGITVETELVLQSMSWSCMQIMGSNARVLGYNGMLTLLVQPQLGILYACKHLQVLKRKFVNELDIISSYNQGSPVKLKDGKFKNQPYVDKVTDRLTYLRRISDGQK